MQSQVIRVAKKEIKFATAKRMLVKVRNLLHVSPDKIEQFHSPQVKDGKWVWKLVFDDTKDIKRRTPIYFSVDQYTLESYLSVTRKTREEMIKWSLKLPVEMNGVTAEEVLQQLGF